MPLSPETVALINRRAERIKEEREKESARNERAKLRHETRKEKIREELDDLNLELRENKDLRKNLFEILNQKSGFKTYPTTDYLCSRRGLAITETSGQIALMTETGIQVVERKYLAGYKKFIGHYREERFAPLSFQEASVDGLFPKTKFKVGELADTIAQIILQSPSKK